MLDEIVLRIPVIVDNVAEIKPLLLAKLLWARRFNELIYGIIVELTFVKLDDCHGSQVM